MLNFKEYKEQYLNESSATTRHYKKYPDKIIDLSFSNKKTRSDIVDVLEKYNIRLKSIITQKNEYYRKLNNDTNTIINKYLDDILKVLCNSYTNNTQEDKYKLRQCIANSEIPKEYPHLIQVKNKVLAVENYYDNYIRKLGIMRGGLSPKTVIESLRIFSNWKNNDTSIDKNAIPAIHALTVFDIPNKIYRGFSIPYNVEDGEILDHDYEPANAMFKKLIMGLTNGKIKQGDVFKYNFGNYSSWTDDISVAEYFANKGGMSYNLIISYKPKKEDIVADLRDTDITNVTRYHNEHEIILNKGNFNFKLEKLSTYDDWENNKIQSKGRIQYQSENWDYMDTVLQILSLNKYKSIKNEDALITAEKIAKSNMIYDDILRNNRFKLSEKSSSYHNIDLENLHPKIASIFIIYGLQVHDPMFYTSHSITTNIVELSNKDKDVVRVEFSDYKNLFRKIKYKIISIVSDITHNNEMYIRNVEGSVKKFLDDITTEDYSSYL